MPIKNPLSDVIESWRGGGVKKGYNEPENIGKGLAERAKMTAEGRKALMPEPAAPAPQPEAPRSPTKRELVKPGAKYGDKPGEKRLDAEGNIIGQMKKGGMVPKTGNYKMHKGEVVLPKEHVMSLAEGVLSQEAPSEPPKPPKEDREMRVRRLKDKSFHIAHSHTRPEHYPDEEYSASDKKALLKHMNDHWKEDQESENDEKKESPGVEEMEKAVGLE